MGLRTIRNRENTEEIGAGTVASRPKNSIDFAGFRW